MRQCAPRGKKGTPPPYTPYRRHTVVVMTPFSGTVLQCSSLFFFFFRCFVCSQRAPVSQKNTVASRLVIVQQKGGVLAMELVLLGLQVATKSLMLPPHGPAVPSSNQFR